MSFNSFFHFITGRQPTQAARKEFTMNLKQIFDNVKAQPLVIDLFPDAKNGWKMTAVDANLKLMPPNSLLQTCKSFSNVSNAKTLDPMATSPTISG